MFHCLFILKVSPPPPNLAVPLYSKPPPASLTLHSQSISPYLHSMTTKLILWLHQFLFISIFFAMNIIMLASGQCLEDQKTLLLQLRDNLTYDASYSTHLVYWNGSIDCCHWPGVTCDRPGRVISLDLSTEWITAGINDSSTLFSLQYLQTLNLATVNLDAAPFPSRFDELAQLTYLNLSDSGFVGPLRNEVSHLTKLATLDLSTSSTSLEIPDLHLLLKNLTNLRELYLDGVNISAKGYEWSQVISSSLPNLTVLSLSNCYLSGPLHSSLAKLQSLSVIHLDANPLAAPVPEFLSELLNLTVLTLSACDLSGTIPNKIFQLPSLRTLDLSNNRLLEGSLPEFPSNGALETLLLSYTAMSGNLPDSISNLKMLSDVQLRGCNFSGPVPNSMAKLTQLVNLDFSINQFTGSIPSFNQSKNLSVLNFYNNDLTGESASSLWLGLDKLVFLDLSANSLSGQIPSSLFSLPSLEVLVLSNNRFSGRIGEVPDVFSSKLAVIELSGNNLEGPIPQFFYEVQNLTGLSLSHNSLTGVVDLINFIQLPYLKNLDLSHNRLSIMTSSNFSLLPSIPQLNSLMLASCNLRTFPQISNQSNLMMLDLSNNQIAGEIPNWIWDLGNGFLRFLNLSHNQLTHLQEPYRFGSLHYLDLHANLLSGQIPLPPLTIAFVDFSNNFISSMPADIGNHLSSAMFFSITNNRVEGEIPLSLCNASSLQVLDLSNNSFHGIIPSCLMEDNKSLGVLNLGRNNLTGSIPEVSLPSCEMETLDVSWNELGGQFPRWLANCTKLEVVNLGYNKITDTFPCWLKNLTNLRVLSLRFNNFQGDISCLSDGYSWPNLQIVDLASNNFDGVLPTGSLTNLEALLVDRNQANLQLDHLRFETLVGQYYQDSATIVLKGQELMLEKILTVFTSIDLSGNNFEGGIPNSVGDLKSLYLLNLSNNHLSGRIPQSIGNLKQLGSLDLSYNKLYGEIPEELANLTFLSHLNLSHNQLSGRIPGGSQLQTFSESSFEGNEGLCGFPLNRTCDFTTEGQPPQSAGGKTQKSFETDLYISASLGFGVGLAFISVPILLSNRWHRYYNSHIDWLICKILHQEYQKQKK